MKEVDVQVSVRYVRAAMSVGASLGAIYLVF